MRGKKNTIYYVGGSKGGIGKSMISTVLVQFLLDKYGDSKTIHLIETDESNPDVGRMYQDKIPVSAFVLDEREAGWVTFFELLEAHENTLFVANSAARSNHGIGVHGANFCSALEEQPERYELVTFWPINEHIDCVNLLLHYLQAVSFGPYSSCATTAGASRRIFSSTTPWRSSRRIRSWFSRGSRACWIFPR